MKEELEPIKDVKIKPDLRLRDLIEVYRSVHGFMAGHIARAADILQEMVREADLRILTFTANIVATGLRGVLAQLIEKKVFNVVITTCGAVDHDIARSYGGRYYKGYFEADDLKLYDEGFHRLGNIYIPLESYGPLIEKVVYSLLDEITKTRQRWGVRELLHELGRRIRDENSILRAAAVNNVPIYVPGYIDGAFGTALFTYSRTHRFDMDLFKDEQEIADLVFKAKKLGALIIGGGISKHHAIWWAQFSEGLDYAVYVTTAVEWDGSLSGAHPREAITWGKIKREGRHVYIFSDATVVVPILASVLIS